MNARQRRFVAEYLVDLNATRAAIRAGYSKKTATKIGSRLLTKVDVAQAIERGQVKKATTLNITAEAVVRELARIGFSDVRQWFDEDGYLRPVHELDDDVAAALGSIEVHREKTHRRGRRVRVEESVIKVKAWDKGRALELLAKHFGLIKEQHEHSGKGGGPIESRVVFGGRYRPDGSRAGA